MKLFALAVLLAVCVAAAGVIGVEAAQASAPPRALPTGPCDEDHILDIEIIDGVLFECSCDQRIFVANDCEWMEITSQAYDPQRAKPLKRHKHRRLIPVLYIRRVSL